MNRVLIGLNALLIVAVVVLFVKVYSPATVNEKTSEATPEKSDAPIDSAAIKTVTETPAPSHAPTGKIAHVNIDRMNRESVELNELSGDVDRKRERLESDIENLMALYQDKIEEFERARKGGILSDAELQKKIDEIALMEKDGANKKLMLDNHIESTSKRALEFRKSVKEFLQKWNQGRFDYILAYTEDLSSVLVGNASLDVTDDVIRELNEAYKQRKEKKQTKKP